MMLHLLRYNAEFRGSTNADFCLPKKLSEHSEHGQLQGVHFCCTSPECRKKETVLAFVEGSAPKEAKFDEWWSEIACSVCDTRYLIRWPASDGDEATVVQRIEQGV